MKKELKYQKEINELKEEFKKINDLYSYANKITSNEKGKDTPRKAFLHEMKSVLGATELYIKEYEFGEVDDEFMEMFLPEANAQLAKANMLERMTGFKDFSKKEISSKYPCSIREIIESEVLSYNSTLNSSNIKTIVKGNAQIYLKPEAMITLISTNFGNAVKYTPKNTKIYISLAEKDNKVKLNLENEFSEKPIRKIGEGNGIGTLITDKILSELNGTKEIYHTYRIGETKNPIWGIEFYLPRNPNNK
jgi:signal transduction histidine kinase